MSALIGGPENERTTAQAMLDHGDTMLVVGDEPNHDGAPATP